MEWDTDQSSAPAQTGDAADAVRQGEPAWPGWLRRGLFGAAAAGLAAAVVLATPRALARAEHLDPLAHAERLISEGRHTAALEALALGQTDADGWAATRARMQRGLCYKALDRPTEALAALREAASGYAGIGDYAAFWEGECLAAAGRPDSAALAYARVRAVAPTGLLQDESLLREAELARASGQPLHAAALCRRVPPGGELGPRALVGLAEALDAGGDSAAARETRAALVRDHPASPEALRAVAQEAHLSRPQDQFYAGVAYARNGYAEAAAHLFRQVARLSSDRAWQGRAQFELGRACFAAKDYRAAGEAFDRAYRVHHIATALFELARCLVRQDRDLEGARLFVAFAGRYPSLSPAPDALWQAAMAHDRLGHRRAARELFQQLAVLYPDSPRSDEALWRAGFTLYKEGSLLRAADAFQELARRTPDPALRDQGYYWAGKALLRAGRTSEAGALIRRAAAGFPASYYALRAQEAAGLRRAPLPEVAPPDSLSAPSGYRPHPGLMRGDLLASLGQYPAAEREYRQTLQAGGEDPLVLGELLRRFEHIGAMNLAFRVSSRMAAAEGRQGRRPSRDTLRRLYPVYYLGEISQTARQTGLDPCLILAVIRQESAFNQAARSPVGATGLMQLMPSTARAMAAKAGLGASGEPDLVDPRVSIRLGAQHLSDHFRLFANGGDRMLSLVLSAYNAGPDKAQRWMRELPTQDADEFVESIPYQETRGYVKLVYRNYRAYSDIVDGEGRGPS